jgi:hypothetical protein
VYPDVCTSHLAKAAKSLMVTVDEVRLGCRRLSRSRPSETSDVNQALRLTEILENRSCITLFKVLTVQVRRQLQRQINQRLKFPWKVFNDW